MSHRWINRGLALAALLAGANALAAPPAADRPFYIEADQVVIDDRKGISVYSGSVRLSQDGVELRADKITVHSPAQRLERVVAEGNPVHYEQKGGPQGRDTRAEARRVEYDVKSRNLLLLDQAHLWQGQNEFSGERIEYDTRREVVTATRSEAEDSRVRVIIQPEPGQPGGGSASEREGR